ncbi:MAG: hypothetical protein LBB57_04840, partial [Clostridiales Family XIII bacterium]|nr:hypothetical protein [Clostridiales Family XIII bacterium]
LTEALTEAAEAAATLAADIEAVNAKYLGSNGETRASIVSAAIEPNRNLYALNRMLRDAFARFDRSGALVLPHAEAFANAEALEAALAALRAKDGAGATEALKKVGFGRYADYDAQVCDFFAAPGRAGTWAAGREAGPALRTDVTIRSLAQKLAEQDTDLSAEIEELDALLAQEKLRLREILDAELSQIEAILPRLDHAIAGIAPLLAAE